MVEIFQRLLSMAATLTNLPKATWSKELCLRLEDELRQTLSQTPPGEPGRSMPAPGGPVESPSRWPGRQVLPLLKQKFAFRLATTSYIIPGAILPNIRFLGPHLDEVELVLFESQDLKQSAHSGRDSRDWPVWLRILTSRTMSTCPGICFLGDPEPALRQAFCATALNFYERTLALNPSAYVLHLDSRKANGEGETDQAAWRRRVHESLDTIQSKGLDLRQVVVENLEYPLEYIAPLAETFGMDLCLDIGHLLRYGHDPGEQLRRIPAQVRHGASARGQRWPGPPGPPAHTAAKTGTLFVRR